LLLHAPNKIVAIYDGSNKTRVFMQLEILVLVAISSLKVCIASTTSVAFVRVSSVQDIGGNFIKQKPLV